MAGKNTPPPADEPVETPPEPVEAVENTPAPDEAPPPEDAPEAPVEDAPAEPEESPEVAAARETLYGWAEANNRPKEVALIRDFAPADLVKAYDDAVAAST